MQAGEEIGNNWLVKGFMCCKRINGSGCVIPFKTGLVWMERRGKRCACLIFFQEFDVFCSYTRTLL